MTTKTIDELVSTALFNYHIESQTLSQEASTLEANGHRLQDSFVLYSEHTHRVIQCHCAETVKRDGEVTHWIYKPITEIPWMLVKEIIIWND